MCAIIDNSKSQGDQFAVKVKKVKYLINSFILNTVKLSAADIFKFKIKIYEGTYMYREIVCILVLF